MSDVRRQHATHSLGRCVEIRHQRGGVNILVHPNLRSFVLRLGPAVDWDCRPRDNRLAQHRCRSIVRMALEGRRQLHNLVSIEREASQSTGGYYPVPCRRSLRTQSTRLWTVIRGDNAQTWRIYIRYIQTGANRLDHQVRTITWQVFFALAEDLYLKT